MTLLGRREQRRVVYAHTIAHGVHVQTTLQQQAGQLDGPGPCGTDQVIGTDPRSALDQQSNHPDVPFV